MQPHSKHGQRTSGEGRLQSGEGPWAELRWPLGRGSAGNTAPQTSAAPRTPGTKEDARKHPSTRSTNCDAIRVSKPRAVGGMSPAERDQAEALLSEANGKSKG